MDSNEGRLQCPIFVGSHYGLESAEVVGAINQTLLAITVDIQMSGRNEESNVPHIRMSKSHRWSWLRILDNLHTEIRTWCFFCPTCPTSRDIKSSGYLNS